MTKSCLKFHFIQALFCAGALVLACGQGARAYVMGQDDREPVSAEEANQPEIAQIGIIETGDGGYVTGILTGANCDVVISAGHAAYYWRDNPARNQHAGALRGGGNFHFRLDPAHSNTSVDMTLVASGFVDVTHLDDDSNDWSIFRLLHPAMTHCQIIAYIGDTGQCRGQVLMPAYHFDRRDTLLVDRSCAIKDTLDHALLIHDCDSKDGSSGAPLYCRDAAGMKLLGINISGVTLKEWVDPGDYGKRSMAFNYRSHKNYAVAIHGDFLRALEAEMQASALRNPQHQ